MLVSILTVLLSGIATPWWLYSNINIAALRVAYLNADFMA